MGCMILIDFHNTFEHFAIKNINIHLKRKKGTFKIYPENVFVFIKLNLV